MTVWKAVMASQRCAVWLTAGARFLHVGSQDDHVCVWALVDPEAERCSYDLVAYGTGRPIAPGDEYLGTAFVGDLVWHVFKEEAAW